MALNVKMSVTIVQLLCLIEEVIQGEFTLAWGGRRQNPCYSRSRDDPSVCISTTLLEHLVLAPHSHYLHRHFK
jgi:hypothetical protein